MLAVTTPFLQKFACVIDGKVIGISVHPDYFPFHYRLNDLKKIRIEGLTKFVQVDGQGQVESILLAEALRAKDTKAAVLPNDSLNDEELAVVFSAIELVNQPAAEKKADTEAPPEIASAIPEHCLEPATDSPLSYESELGQEPVSATEAGAASTTTTAATRPNKNARSKPSSSRAPRNT